MHVNAILNQEYGISDAVEPLKQLLNKEPKWRSRYIPVAVSTERIPFAEGLNVDISHLQSEDGFVHLVPSKTLISFYLNEFLAHLSESGFFIVVYLIFILVAFNGISNAKSAVL